MGIEDDEKSWLEAIQIMHDFANKTDEINKRLIKALVIVVVAFCTTITICFSVLYLSDYSTTINQQQQQMSSNGQMQQQQK